MVNIVCTRLLGYFVSSDRLLLMMPPLQISGIQGPLTLAKDYDME